jgi:hypothetical protein
MRAFIVRLKPGIDLTQSALRNNRILIGWGKACDLLKPGLSQLDFRNIIQRL